MNKNESKVNEVCKVVNVQGKKGKKAEYVYFDLSGQDVLKSIYSNNRQVMEIELHFGEENSRIRQKRSNGASAWVDELLTVLRTRNFHICRGNLFLDQRNLNFGGKLRGCYQQFKLALLSVSPLSTSKILVWIFALQVEGWGVS